MKIISLNVWSGRLGQPLLDFFEENKDVDIFCLQEVDRDGDKFEEDYFTQEYNGEDPHLFSKITDILENHVGYFSPQLGEYFGLAMFIKKDLYDSILETGDRVVSDKQKNFCEYKTWFRRTIQWIDFQKNGKEYSIVNFHGLWKPGRGKGDSPERLEQSNNIVNFLELKRNKNIILAGDFNLSPDTESVKIIENFPLRNLIRDYNITDTRTSHYPKDNRFADYIFTQPGLNIKDFKVSSDEVSDHAPLYLEIE